MEHIFVTGDPQRPSSTWTIVAPLYFKADADNRRAVEGYCSPACATRGLGA